MLKKILLLTGLVALGFAAGLAKRQFVDDSELLVFSNRSENSATLLEQALPIPEFTLNSTRGEPMTKDKLLSQWTYLFFGYTHCPDICPTTLTFLNQVRAALKKDAGKTRIVFVTLDAARDNLAHLKDYLAYFNKDIIGLSGDTQQIDALAKKLGVFYEVNKKEGRESDYSLNHTASIFFVEPGAGVKALFSDTSQVDKVAQISKRLIERS